ncbi:MAG: anhydro-N-acetylmuramic acid kinase [Phycisphaerales bacterium]|nr:anhydro-N-acetylmuramic acid kinase [Phycisphaerales bacterium]
MARRLVIGCMSGTSLDGLDAALVEIEGTGLAMQARFLELRSRPFGELEKRLRSLADQSPMSSGAIARIRGEFVALHVELVRELAGGRRPDLIVVHGQTIHHCPPLTWQLFDPAPLVHALRAPVVCDLRNADVAAGGQGAPITPLADFILFRDARERRAVVNLGGFVNFTWLPAVQGRAASELITEIRGGDVCVCNQLLNEVSRRAFAEPHDDRGRRAGEAAAPPALRESLRRLLATQATGRSLGTGDECREWAEQFLVRFSGEQLLRACCEVIASCIGAALEGKADRVLLAGGGARNETLSRLIAESTGVATGRTDEFGIPIDAREAAEMAVLGALAADGVQITLPQVTKPTSAVGRAGVWAYP